MDDKRLSRFINQWLIVFGVLILILGALAASGKCTETELERPIGDLVPTINNNVYIFGTLVGGTVMKDPVTGKWATGIRLQPVGTPLVYEESVLLCGDRVEDFKGMQGVIVVTYRRTAHERFQEIACHSLVSVSEVVIKGKSDVLPK